MDVIALILPPSPSLRIQTSLPPSPTSVPVPPKRLRSCLSPSRRQPSQTPFGGSSTFSSASTDEPSLTCSSSPMTSRSASFSSQDDPADCAGWRRGRSVRWDESGGCVMAAYYSTWSADDYDRSPLEPPKPEERACLMPARGSRCLSPLDCFADVNPDDAFFPPQTFQSFVTESSPIIPVVESPTETETEDKEWEECMERRRMMFAQMRQPASQSSHNEEESEEKAERRFEGYTSISANLVALLASSGIGAAPGHVQGQTREVATPVGTPVELDVAEACGAFGIGFRPKLVRVEHRLRVSRSFSSEEEVVEEETEDDEAEAEDDDDAEEGEDVDEPSAETVMAALRAMRMGPGRELRTGAEERERTF